MTNSIELIKQSFYTTVWIFFYEFSLSFFTMPKLFFSMTKFRHIPGIKLLKNVSNSITSHRLDKNVNPNILLHEFWHFSQIPWVFQAWKIKLQFSRFSMTHRNPVQVIICMKLTISDWLFFFIIHLPIVGTSRAVAEGLPRHWLLLECLKARV